MTFSKNRVHDRLIAFLCLVLCTGAGQSALAAVPSSMVDSEYQIGPENALQVDIYYGKGEKISQKVRVSSRGYISLPLVGEVEAAGLTVFEFQQKVYTLLEKDYLVNPQVTVFIEEYSSVSIMGEVEKPGSYPIKGRLTILGLVSLAEGFTKIANANNVKIIRIEPDGSKIEIPVSLSNLISVGKGNEQEDVQLQARDVVFVPKSVW